MAATPNSPNPNAENPENETFAFVMQIVTSSVFPMAMEAAIDLKIFDIISKCGPSAKLTATEIVTYLQISNPIAPMMVDRILRLLASHSVLNCTVDGSQQRLYSLSPVTNYFVSNENGVSLGPLMALIQDKVFLESWPELKNAVIEGGIPFNKVHGMHAFEYPGKDARFNHVFNTAMLNHTTIVINKIIEVYKGFEKIKKLVDVGGGLGKTLGLITSKFPTIKGVNFDLPHVIQHAPPYQAVEHVGGDMFESVPEGEAIFMKWILHDWSDELSIKLLKNCYKALPKEGKVIVVEAILPIMADRNWTTKSLSQIDVLMMTQNPGGMERSQNQFLVLAKSSGFSGIHFVCNVCNFWVMEFYK